MSSAEKSWLRRRFEKALTKALWRAYKTVRVDPDRFLMEIRAGYGLPVTSFGGMYSVEPPVLDSVAETIIHSAMKMAAAEGAGLGVGGILTIVPDFSILAGITLRTIQKLSLLYGFEYNTDKEVAELWMAAASAAGIDLGREFLEKNVVNRLVLRIIQRIAAKASTEFVEKWAGRLIPVVSSLIGGALNYWFVRGWGERAHAHFRQKHLAMRRKLSANLPAVPSLTIESPSSAGGRV
ncbi:MAG: EcsC family protein [Acidobacteria bacterium]|nr:EcsC family protein [Acidobacteriota bacterium]